MKKTLALIFIFSCLFSFAQAPQGINYQGVIRDNAGNALSMATVSVEFKIWQGNPSLGGSIIYSELHNGVVTDTFGLYSLVIGSTSGSGIGTFNTIPWSTGNKWVEVYVDPSNGTSFNLVSSQQLMSVPYALYAETSGGGGSINGMPNNLPKINSAGNGLKPSLIYESADSSSIGINNPNPLPDAVLDIVNTGAPGGPGKGLLIPRMTYAERTAIATSNLHHGLLVFQTNSQNSVAPEGFWYYDAVNASWLLLAPAQAVWTLSGNLSGASSFMGTLNDADVVFKTGNTVFSPTERMRILGTTNGGNVQFGNSSLGSHYIFPATKGNAGDILQLDPSGTNNLIWKPIPGSGNVAWLTNGNVGGALDFLGTTGTFPLQISTTNTITAQPIIFSTNGAERMRVGANGNVGIGINAPNNVLDVVGNSNSAIVHAVNNTTVIGDGIFGTTAGSGSGVNGSNSGSGPGVSGISSGTGTAGYFMVNNATNTSAALSVSHQGKGPIGVFTNTLASNGSSGIDVTSVGSGASLFATNTGTGSAGNFLINSTTSSSSVLNASTNGKGSAGNFQITNASSTSPAVNVSTSSPTSPGIAVNGSGPGGIAALLLGGTVGISTPTPSSGLDVKTSLAISVIKHSTAGNIGILPNDQNVVHLCATSGTFTYALPDATLCPGRLLVFGADQSVTGGTFILSACCSQTINGGASQSFNITTGLTKPSIGIISDGSNWQIIFRN